MLIKFLHYTRALFTKQNAPDKHIILQHTRSNSHDFQIPTSKYEQ